jgi:hypothetical protein
MKKVIYLLILAAGFKVAAQSSTSIGINAGSTLSWLRGNDIAKQNDPAVNFLVGVSLELPVSNNLAFFTSLNYERKSVSRNIPFSSLGMGNVPDPNDPAFRQGGFDVRYTLSYLTVPINIRYYIGSGKKFYINGGPYAGFILGDSAKIEGRKAEDENGDYKSVEFGINAGLGFRVLSSSKHNLDIELRDNLGLTNIYDGPVVDNGTVKTNTLNLIANWSFNL